MPTGDGGHVQPMEEAGLRKAPKGSSLLKHTAKRGRAAEAGGGTEAKVHQWDV